MFKNNESKAKNFVQEFFDENYQIYNVSEESFEKWEIDFLNNNNAGSHFLDIGCGDATVSNKILRETQIERYTGIDLSRKFLLSKNERSNKNPNVNKIQGSVESLPFKTDSFDVVYIHWVMHHLIGKSRKKSKKIVINSLNELCRITKKDGYIILTDIFYDGRIIQKLASYGIFYSLKILPPKLFKKIDDAGESGLEVCFYTSKEWKEFINKNSTRILRQLQTHCNTSTHFVRKMLLSDYGNITFI